MDGDSAGPESPSWLYSHGNVKKYVAIFHLPQLDFRRCYLHFLVEENNTQANRGLAPSGTSRKRRRWGTAPQDC